MRRGGRKPAVEPRGAGRVLLYFRARVLMALITLWIRNTPMIGEEAEARVHGWTVPRDQPRKLPAGGVRESGGPSDRLRGPWPKRISAKASDCCLLIRHFLPLTDSCTQRWACPILASWPATGSGRRIPRRSCAPPDATLGLVNDELNPATGRIQIVAGHSGSFHA